MPQNRAKSCQNLALSCLILAASFINPPLQARDLERQTAATLYLLSQEDLKTRADRLNQEGFALFQQGTAESIAD